MGGELVNGARHISQCNDAAQSAEIGPTFETGRQQLKWTSLEVNLQTEDGLNARIPASRDKLNRTREQVVIGQSQRGHAASLRGLDKFNGRGKSLLQGVCRVAGEMDGHQGVLYSV
jgi:hypothetical protein